MPEPARPHRRTFVGAMGWVMGVLGVGAVGYTLFRSTETPGVDPRVRVELPEKPEGFEKVFSVLGRPVGVIGLSPAEAADLNRAPGAPPFLVLNVVCTYNGCVVGRQRAPDTAAWVCPCCGSGFRLDGRHAYGPARRDLTVPPFSFIGRRTVLIGPRFLAT